MRDIEIDWSGAPPNVVPSDVAGCLVPVRRRIIVDYSYYELKDVKYPIKPRKPAIPYNNVDPEAFREYATKLEEWESLLEEYEEKRNSVQKLATERMREFEDELFSLYAYAGTSREIFDVIYQKAWDDGHSDGLYSVAERVDELCGFVDDIIKIVKNNA